MDAPATVTTLPFLDSRTQAWLRSAEGERALAGRVAAASKAFDADLLSRLVGPERPSSQGTPSERGALGNRLRVASEELAILAFGKACGVSVRAPSWKAAREQYLPLLASLSPWCFQGAGNNPPWLADLTTADLGVNLAFSLRFAPELDDATGSFAKRVLERSLEPIVADWIDPLTRRHSFDSMGHNWWAVIVAGGGIVGALLGRHELAARAAENLKAWFRFPGNEFSRKRPNFGPEGDFLESFHYAEYALSSVALFERVFPSFRLVPDGLAETQARGLAEWLRLPWLETDEGWRMVRFGDINPKHRPRCEVWHALVRATEDRRLLALSHELKSAPETLPEFLLWLPREEARRESMSEKPDLRVYPISGAAFSGGDALVLAVRAGEFWNHNHLDAGTFAFWQDGVLWADDAGSCGYGHPDYLDYFIGPEAHNVAYAPALRPPLRRAFCEGLPQTGRYLRADCRGPVAALCVDTGVLSGGALSRSLRWFFRLGDSGVLVWDDLSAYAPQRFASLLNTQCAVVVEEDGRVSLRQGGRTCPVYFHADAPAKLSCAPAEKGSENGRPCSPQHERRTCVSWTTDPVDRLKLGLALGSRFQSCRWSGSWEEGGWACDLEDKKGGWNLWFNPNADGRNTHLPAGARCGAVETDAYALIFRTEGGRRRAWAVEASFARSDGAVHFDSPSRTVLRDFELSI